MHDASHHMPGAAQSVSETVTADLESGPRIAFIDDDNMFRSAMAACLRMEGFTVLEFSRHTSDIDRIVAERQVDAVLQDGDMRTARGASLLDHLLHIAADVPVALMAARCKNSHEEAALLRGAADYLGKSRGPTVVAKRLRLLIGARNAGVVLPVDENSVDIGPLTLRLGSHRALWRDRQVPLTVTEFRIVRLLASNFGRSCSHRKIYDVVHGSGFAAGDGPNGYRTNVRSLIRKIRARFRRLDRNFAEIENVAGYGYRWRDPEAAAQPTASAAGKAPSDPHAAPPA